MGTYTMRLQEIIQFYGDESIKGWNNKISAFAPTMFDFDFPFYGLSDQEISMNRLAFEQMFIKHYLMREIGYETYELWKLRLDDRLNLIMPRYIQLYRTTLFEVDLDNPYHLITTHDQDTTETGNTVSSGNSTDDNTVTNSSSRNSDQQENNTRTNNLTTTDNGSKNTKGNSDSLFSDFPNSSFENGDYATNRTQGEESGNETNQNTRKDSGTVTDKGGFNIDETLNSTENADNKHTFANNEDRNLKGTLDYLREVKGHTNNMDVLNAVEKWRKLIVNINELIINELADLFILLYN